MIQVKVDKKGISPKTFFRIADAALSHRDISRIALSKMTGVSAVTVGKAVDSLIEAGILTERKEPASRGRRASLLSPSDSVTFLIMNIDRINQSVILTDTLGKAIYSCTKQNNETVTFEDNFRAMVSYVHGNDRLMKKAGAQGIICRKSSFDIERDPLTRAIGYSPDVMVGHLDLISDYLCNRFPDSTVYYIYVSEYILGVIVSNGTRVYDMKHGRLDVSLKEKTADGVLNQLAAILRDVFIFSCADYVVVESNVVTVDDSFIDSLRSKLTYNYRIDGRVLPKFVTFPGMSCPNTAMAELLRHKFAQMLSSDDFGNSDDIGSEAPLA
ncbi:MAG: hypothetical protein ACI3XQ_06405 [Eubacteriales bacterium]